MTLGLAERNMTDAIAQQDWLEPVDQTLNNAVDGAFTGMGPIGQQVRNFLHGTWLGHPLHPALTDVPVGAWTTALAFDALDLAAGRIDLQPGADAAVGLGLLGAAGAALAGLTDWQKTYGKARRVGLVHGLLNVGVVGLYGASLVCRKSGARGAGRALAAAGYLVAFYSTYLGGTLVYQQRIGVDHTNDLTAAPPSDFTRVLADADLKDGALKKVEAAGVPVLLARQHGQVYALADTCAHLGCSLADGTLDDGSVTCPCHGSRYALEDGRVIDGPSTFPQLAYEARVRDGQIEVRLTE
ncbi:MAG TPA: Rieske (2Fe-2S) protein [Thermomicrobiales bacterium]|nr:Rieske (2Fe-2S) protein [Thermomicrobiales bacterium]